MKKFIWLLVLLVAIPCPGQSSTISPTSSSVYSLNTSGQIVDGSVQTYTSASSRGIALVTNGDLGTAATVVLNATTYTCTSIPNATGPRYVSKVDPTVTLTGFTVSQVNTSGLPAKSEGIIWHCSDGDIDTRVKGAAGSNHQIQFNSSGALGASSALTWDGSTLTATSFTGSGVGLTSVPVASLTGTGTGFNTAAASNVNTANGFLTGTAAWTAPNGSVSFTNLTSVPTTLAGYGLSWSSLIVPVNTSPTVTGTVYTATTAAEFQNYINGSTPASFANGDAIRLTSSITVTADLLPATGRLAGVTIEANAGVVITPTDATHGRWVIKNGGSANHTAFRTRDPWNGRFRIKADDTTAKTTAVTGNNVNCFMFLGDGSFDFNDMEIGGTSSHTPSGDLICTIADAFACIANFNNCYFHDSGADVVSAGWFNGGSTASNSLTTGNNSPVYRSGPGSSDQTITCHNGHVLVWKGIGTVLYNDSTINVSGDGTALEIDGIDCQGTGLVNPTIARNCKINHVSALSSPTIWQSNHVTITSANVGGNDAFRLGDNANYCWNLLTGPSSSDNGMNGVDIYNTSVGATVIGNEITGFGNVSTGNDGLRVNENAAGTNYIASNYIYNCYFNYDFRAPANPTLVFNGNRSGSSVSGGVTVNVYDANQSESGAITWKNSGWNLIPATANNYTGQAYDTNDATAWGLFRRLPTVEPSSRGEPISIGSTLTLIWQTNSAVIAGGAGRTELGSFLIIREDGVSKAVTPSYDWWGIAEKIGANYTQISINAALTDSTGALFFISGKKYSVFCVSPVVEGRDLGTVLIGSFLAL